MSQQKRMIVIGTYREWRTSQGVLHRIGGPAVETKDGSKLWYVMGKYIGWQTGIRSSAGNFISSDRHGIPRDLPPGYEEAP